MRRKLLSLLVVFAMALSMVPMVSAAGEYVAPPTIAEIEAAAAAADNYGLIPGERFAPGVWTKPGDAGYVASYDPEEPTNNEINTASELQWFLLNGNGTYTLGSDIDCRGAALTGAESAGNDRILDGSGHTISNLYYTPSGNSTKTDFGYMRNVCLANASLRGSAPMAWRVEGTTKFISIAVFTSDNPSDEITFEREKSGSMPTLTWLSIGDVHITNCYFQFSNPMTHYGQYANPTTITLDHCFIGRLIGTNYGSVTNYVTTRCVMNQADDPFSWQTKAHGTISFDMMILVGYDPDEERAADPAPEGMPEDDPHIGRTMGGEYTPTNAEGCLVWASYPLTSYTGSVYGDLACTDTTADREITLIKIGTDYITTTSLTPALTDNDDTQLSLSSMKAEPGTKVSIASTKKNESGLWSDDLSAFEFESDDDTTVSCGTTEGTMKVTTETAEITVASESEDASQSVNIVKNNGTTETYILGGIGVGDESRVTLDTNGSLTSTTTDPETGEVTVQKTVKDENGNITEVTTETYVPNEDGTLPEEPATKTEVKAPEGGTLNDAVKTNPDGSVAITGEVEVQTTKTDPETGEPVTTTTKIDGSNTTEGNEPTLSKTGDVSATPGTTITPNNSNTPIEVGEGQTITLPADNAGDIEPSSDGTGFSLPAGTTVKNGDSEVTLDEQSEVSADGSMTATQFTKGGTTITSADGTTPVTLAADGTVSAGAVINANGTTFTASAATNVVNADGSVTVAEGETITVAGAEVTATGTTMVVANGTTIVDVGTAGQTDYSINGAVITYDADPQGYWYVAETTEAATAGATTGDAMAIEGLDEWFPEYSEFFNIEALGANAEPAANATVTMPSSKASRTNVVKLAYWDTDSNAWGVNNTLAAGEAEGTVTFTTDHFSSWVFGDPERPHYYATVTLTGTGVEDLYADEAAEAAAYPDATWAANSNSEGLHHNDDSGNPVNDLKVGDTFHVDVKSTDAFLTGWMFVKWDSQYLNLENAATLESEGWERTTQSNDGTMEYWRINLGTSGNEEYAAETALTSGFDFTLQLPEDFDENTLPKEVWFQFDESRHNAITKAGGYLSGEVPNFGTSDTLVRIADPSAERVVEVVKYGQDAALILVYSKDAGSFVYEDTEVLTNDSATLLDVTDAGYVYRFTENDTEVTYGEDGTSTFLSSNAFYDKFAAGETPYVYGLVVNLTRLTTAVADATDWIDAADIVTNQGDIEAYVLDRLTFHKGAETVKAIYTGGANVDVDLNPGTDDQTWIRAIAFMTGTSKADEAAATAWTMFHNGMLSGNNKVALQTDFLRTPQSTDSATNRAKLVDTNEWNEILEQFGY